jgi:hypothetical protein
MKKSSLRSRIASGSLLLLGAACVGSLLAAVQVPPLMLTGAQEVPAVETTATATSTIEIRPDLSVTGAVETTGIVGTMAHIHMAPAGMNGPVIVTLEKSGDNRWVVPAGTHLTVEQNAALKAGGLYVNVHSAAHKSGELRLQLIGG